ncbi:MAG: hypothetical protein K0S27_336, partial [Gammaproteobacteria bacterium]|nr:hypothetical protein [Gammaproteobacteria bacterium]
FLLEGTFKTTFPSLGYKYLMVDATSWINLDSGQYDMQAYIKALTSLSDPVGILPAILGLQRMDDDYEAYRDSCRQDYLVHVSALKSQLEKIYAFVPAPEGAPGADAEEKQSLPHQAHQDITPLERWMESLTESIHSSEGSQKALQKKEAAFFERYAFLAYEKAQTDESLSAPRGACEETHQRVLQKLREGKQAFVNRNAALFTVERETQLREALLEREARVNQLENQRSVLESTRAELTTELDAHKSKAGLLEQDIRRQQAQQINLVKDSVVLAERQNAKLEQLLQQVPASNETKEEVSDCQELLSDILLKTQKLKSMGEGVSPDFERCNELMIDLGKHYQRCYVAIIKLMRQAGVGNAANDAKIEQEKAGQELQEWKKRYDTSHLELAAAKQAHEETKRLLAEKEARLSSLGAREQTLSTELEKKQAVLEEVLQRQEALEKEKAQVSELTRANEAQKSAWEEEQNKLRQQLQAIEKQSAEQLVKIERLKEVEKEKDKQMEAEKAAASTSLKAQTELNAQAALQAEAIQKLKEELAAEKKKWAEEKEKSAKAKELAEKLALEKAQIEAVRQSAEKIQAEQREKVKAEAQAEKVQAALQAEDLKKLKEKFATMEAEAASVKAKAEQLAAEKAPVEADQKYAEKIQAEQAKRALEEEERSKAEAEQAQKEQERAEQKNKAIEEEKKEEGTEGRMKVHSRFWKLAKATPPDVTAFLRLVAEGEQDKAENLLKANPGLWVAAGSVTDLSKRTFKNITALQYALWALDWNMWMMLLKYIPREEAQLQAMALEKGGTEHGKCFDFSQLLGAYESYKQNHDAWCNAEAWDKMEAHWCQQVGGAQLLLPAHVVNEYCRPDRAFYPLPNFNEEGLPRSRGLYNKAENEWYTKEYNGGQLGCKWACARGMSGAVAVWCIADNDLFIEVDHSAVAALSETRLLQQQSMMKELLTNKPLIRKKR